MTNKKQQVLQIIQLVCEENPDAISAFEKAAEHTHLRNDLQLDSLALAELTVRIEDEFQVDIFEDGIIHTLGDIYQRLAI